MTIVTKPIELNNEPEVLEIHYKLKRIIVESAFVMLPEIYFGTNKFIFFPTIRALSLTNEDKCNHNHTSSIWIQNNTRFEIIDFDLHETQVIIPGEEVNNIFDVLGV